MTTKPIEVHTDWQFDPPTEADPLLAWAKFLAPEEVETVRIEGHRYEFVPRVRANSLPAPAEFFAAKEIVKAMIGPPGLTTALVAPAKDEIEDLIAWSLRDENYDPSANDRIERAWDDL
jgi:hypothetical protein